jgi:hypothetical protein
MNNWDDILGKLKSNSEIDIDFIKEVIKKEGAEEAIYNELSETLKGIDPGEHISLDYIVDYSMILAELNSERSFDLFLKILSYEEEVIDLLLGDTLNGSFTYALYKTGKNRIEELFEFVKNEKYFEYARVSVMQSVLQINSVNPELKEMIVENFRKLADIQILKEHVIVLSEEYRIEELKELSFELYNQDKSLARQCDMDEWNNPNEPRKAYKNIEEAYESLLNMAMINKIGTIYQEEMSVKGFGLYDGLENENFDDFEFEFQKPRTSKKIGRNEPCPCGSGKKYKKCCLNSK